MTRLVGGPYDGQEVEKKGLFIEMPRPADWPEWTQYENIAYVYADHHCSTAEYYSEGKGVRPLL